MKTTLCAATTLVGCVLVFSACSSDSPTSPSGTAGQTSTPGGATGVAGSAPVGTAGASATGGAPPAGGGAPAAGGTPAAGGSVTSGGSPGTGGASTGTGVTVALGSALQTMDGFGINDTWATAMTAAQADSLFDPTKGIGLSILRIGMGPDGKAMSDNIWPDVKLAAARGVTRIIGSTWTAPATCKTNNNVNDGGHLISNDGGTCYNSWATTIAAFPALVKSSGGVDLYAMSVGNEPEFASCGSAKPCNGNYPTMLYTATEAVNFMKIVGPKLHAASSTVKVMTPEASEWIHLWTNMSAPGSTDPLKGVGYDYGHALAADATAWAQVDIVGVHEYDTQVAQAWPSDVTSKKPIWQTEMSGVKWWPEEGPSSDIANGVVVAGWIHDAIVNGPASAWLWWWYQASGTDDNEGLYLKNGTDTKRHYTLGNYSKFIRPGYTRVDVTGNASSDVLLTAYKATDGTVVIVAINKGAAAVTLPITISGGTAPAMLTPNVTSATDNLVAKTAIPVTGGVFMAALDTKTVTTFVGK